MKLLAVRVHNFRGVIEQEITLQPYSLLVGANNAGKSTFIDAIRAFYEKDGFKYKPASDFPYKGASDEESWVELRFQLSDEEHASLADVYQTPDKCLVARKYFQTKIKGAAGSIFANKTDGTLSDEPFYGAKNVGSGKFGDLIYIPAVSKVDDHTKLTGPSALRDLLSNVMADVLEGGEAYKTFAESVGSFAKVLRTERTKDDRSLNGFEEAFNELLDPWQTKFELRFSPPAPADIIKQMVGWELLDEFHGRAQSIDGYGSGFQRHFIYSLIRIGAQYAGQEVSKKGKDFTPDLTLILFEEPEAFLHPPQQEILARGLMAWSSSSTKQVICSSHSSHFVSRKAESIPAIVRVMRTNGTVTAHQITDTDWSSIVNANQAINAIASKYSKMAAKLHQDDAKPDMEAVKHFLWLNTDRSSIFFANHVLLVEGPTEVALLNKLIDDGKIKGADCGLVILDCLGKYNIHRFMNLVSHLGIRHSVLHDDDNDKDEHLEINQLIKDTAHSALTLHVQPIRGDLETMLSISSAGSDHRKPQHVLYLYSEGKIDSAKLDAFCLLVEGCLPLTKKQPSLTSETPEAAEIA